MPWNEFLDKLNNTLAEFPFCQALLSMKTGIVDIMYRKKIVTASKETKNIYYNVIGDKYLNTPYAEIEIAVPYDKIRKGIVFILTTLRQNENFRKYLHKKFIDETLLLRFVGKNKRSLIAMTSDRDLSVFFSMVGDAKRSKDPVLLDIFRIFHDYFVNELKGRPHYGKHNFLTTKEMKRLYPKFNKFKEIMEELDPNKVFVNDYIERLFYQPIKLKNKYIISRNK